MQYENVFDRAFQIAISTINDCKGYGGFVPNSGSHYVGIWLRDPMLPVDTGNFSVYNRIIEMR